MAIKITGIEDIREDKHSFSKSYAFMDSECDFFIVGEHCTVIRMNPTFSEFNRSGYDYIEDFIEEVFGTTLLKSFENHEDFEIEIKIK